MTKCTSVGAENKVQQWVLEIWGSRTQLNTPDGHTADNTPKLWSYVEMCKNSNIETQIPH